MQACIQILLLNTIPFPPLPQPPPPPANLPPPRTHPSSPRGYGELGASRPTGVHLQAQALGLATYFKSLLPAAGALH